MPMGIAAAPQEYGTRAKGVVGLFALTLVLAVAGTGGWLLTHRDGDPITYDSVRTMAAKIGCENTLAPARHPGGASSAGRCTLTDGTLVDLRVYAGAGEGVAWLDGTADHRLPGRSVAVTGGSWVALVHSGDLVVGNSVVGPLTTP